TCSPRKPPVFPNASCSLPTASAHPMRKRAAGSPLRSSDRWQKPCAKCSSIRVSAMAERLPAPEFERKIVAAADLVERVAALPRPVVLTNGVFDLLHRGHVTYLAQARSLGASLVVAMNSDRSVKLLGKGDDRPINMQADRA